MPTGDRTFPNTLLSGYIHHSSGLGGIPCEGDTPVDRFNSLVKHFVQLRGDGILDDETFSSWVKYAAALLVEAEVGNCISQVLDEKVLAIPFEEHWQ